VNIYCDESRHLEHDKSPIMVLGAISCPQARARDLAVKIRKIKEKHNLPGNFEIKWTKVSPAGINFYQNILDYFFTEQELRFRAVIAHRAGLNHTKFKQDHDAWYYKMYFLLLGVLLSPTDKYRIYLDIKDTRSQSKVEKLREILCNSKYDFDRKIIESIQQVRSHEVEQIQLADLLIGAIGFANQEQFKSVAKRYLVEYLREKSNYSLTKSTLLEEKKLNLFHWTPKEQ